MPKTSPKKPSHRLGFLMVVLLGLFASFMVWQIRLPIASPDKLTVPQWVFVFGGVTAMAGWIVNAMVTITNSIRQHTINTLLQSRLSVIYAQRVTDVNTYFLPQGKPFVISEEFVLAPPEGAPLQQLGYLLNYFEFVAVGIKHGDLDERLLKDSMRGIVKSLMQVSRALINYRQKTLGPKTYEHFVWLHERWAPEPGPWWKSKAA